jgi:hypothetical protein
MARSQNETAVHGLPVSDHTGSLALAPCERECLPFGRLPRLSHDCVVSELPQTKECSRNRIAMDSLTAPFLQKRVSAVCQAAENEISHP